MKTRKLLYAVLLAVVVALTGCSAITKNAVFQKKIDMSDVEEYCIIGKTTPQQVISRYGEPYQNEVTKRGNGRLYYVSMGFFGGDAQDLMFIFEKGRLVKYGSPTLPLSVGNAR